MKTKAEKQAAVIKALKKANRELERERHGADHPWIAVNRPHKNKKKYNRKDQKKELRHTLGSFDSMLTLFVLLGRGGVLVDGDSLSEGC